METTAINEVPLGEPTNFEERIREFVMKSNVAMQTLHFESHEIATRTKIITPFLQALGWDPASDRFLADQIPESVDSRLRPDYLLLDEDHRPRAVIEAKSHQSSLGGDPVRQTKDNIRAYSVRRGILTDGGEYRVYARESVDHQRVEEVGRIFLRSLPDALATLRMFTPEAIGGETAYMFNGAPEELVELLTNDAYDSIDMEVEEFVEKYAGWLASEETVLEAWKSAKGAGVDDPIQLPTGPDSHKELVKTIVGELHDETNQGAPVDEVLQATEEHDIERDRAEHVIHLLKDDGEVFVPKNGYLRLV